MESETQYFGLKLRVSRGERSNGVIDGFSPRSLYQVHRLHVALRYIQ